MKKIFIILFVGFYSYSFSQDVYKTTLIGYVTEPTEKTIQFGDKKVEISTDGNFQFDPDIDKPTFYNIRYEKDKLLAYIEQGENMDISFNANHNYKLFNSIPEINHYLGLTNIDDPEIIGL